MNREAQYILINIPITECDSADFEMFKNELEIDDPIRSAFGGWMTNASDYETYYYSSFNFKEREVEKVVITYLREINDGTFNETMKDDIIDGLIHVCKEVDHGAILYLINETDAMIIKDNYIGGKFPIADIENKALFWEMVKIMNADIL